MVRIGDKQGCALTHQINFWLWVIPPLRALLPRFLDHGAISGAAHRAARKKDG